LVKGTEARQRRARSGENAEFAEAFEIGRTHAGAVVEAFLVGKKLIQNNRFARRSRAENCRIVNADELSVRASGYQGLGDKSAALWYRHIGLGDCHVNAGIRV